MNFRAKTIKIASLLWVVAFLLGPVAVEEALEAQATLAHYSHGPDRHIDVDGVRIALEIPPQRESIPVLAQRGPASTKTK